MPLKIAAPTKDDRGCSILSPGLLPSCAYLQHATLTSLNACVTQCAVLLYASAYVFITLSHAGLLLMEQTT